MRVLPDGEADVRVKVELTGRELQVIHRAIEYVVTPPTSPLHADEVDLATEIGTVLDEYGLDRLDR